MSAIVFSVMSLAFHLSFHLLPSSPPLAVAPPASATEPFCLMFPLSEMPCISLNPHFLQSLLRCLLTGLAWSPSPKEQLSTSPFPFLCPFVPTLFLALMATGHSSHICFCSSLPEHEQVLHFVCCVRQHLTHRSHPIHIFC